MTKIDIVSGFLGAGKTTLIRKLIADALAGTRVVLIENEFGEIGIDGGFLKEAGIEIREMNSGCICCSLVGDFGTALKEVMKTYAPERILIEPSGVGKLSEIMEAVHGKVLEEILIIARCHIAGQQDGLVEVITDGIAYHTLCPMLQRRILLIGRNPFPDIVSVQIQIAHITLSQECVAKGLVLLNLQIGQ